MLSTHNRLKAFTSALATHSLAGEFARYFAAGLVALGVDFSLYIALTELAGWHYMVSAAVAFCAGLGTVYLFSILWVFRERRAGLKAREFALFAAIGIAGLALTAALIFALTEFAGLDYRLSKVASAALVFVFNFGCRKYFLFSVPRRQGVRADSDTS